MFAQFKLYIYGAIAIAFLTLVSYCYILKNKNETLIAENAKIGLIAQQKQDAAQQCSDSVANLRKEEEAKAKAVGEAIEKAKKEAVEDYKEANKILFQKPKAPVITEENKKDFNNGDKEAQLKDFLAAKQLMNEQIKARKERK